MRWSRFRRAAQLITVDPDQLKGPQDPRFPSAPLLVGVGVDNVVEGLRGPGARLRVLVAAVEQLNQQGQAPRLAHGHAAVRRAAHGQQRSAHVLAIMGPQHGQQPIDHLHFGAELLLAVGSPGRGAVARGALPADGVAHRAHILTQISFLKQLNLLTHQVLYFQNNSGYPTCR